MLKPIAGLGLLSLFGYTTALHQTGVTKHTQSHAIHFHVVGNLLVSKLPTFAQCLFKIFRNLEGFCIM